MESKICAVLKVTRQYPLVRLINELEEMESEEGNAMGSGLFEYAAEGSS